MVHLQMDCGFVILAFLVFECLEILVVQAMYAFALSLKKLECLRDDRTIRPVLAKHTSNSSKTLTWKEMVACIHLKGSKWISRYQWVNQTTKRIKVPECL